MTSVGIMQPYFFPYLGYFQHIHAVDTFVPYPDLDFIKGGWVSRNRLLAVNGEPFHFVVPLARKSSNRLIRETTIASTIWRDRLAASIRMNYARSPHFDDIYPTLESIISHQSESLYEINRRGIEGIATLLGISTKILHDVDFEDLEANLALPSDRWLEVFPDVALDQPAAKVIRVIEICRRLGADTFINPIGGAPMYHPAEFGRHGIDARFIEMDQLWYPQVCAGYETVDDFRSNMSIIDVLMNCGVDHTRALLDQAHLR